MADRLRDVHVGVRADLDVTRHVFRGTSAYVISDPISFASHRLSARDYELFVAIDDERTLGAIFETLVERRVLTAADEEGFYQFVLSMHQLGFLSLPISNEKALYRRFVRRRAQRHKELTRGFLFLRVPLVDPDRFLARTLWMVRPLFSRPAFALWLMIMAACAIVVTRRWDDLAAPFSGLLATQNLIWMWVLLISLKVIHELGHGYACRFFGGAVPEMGAYIILLTPCAYVDATASWGFTRKRDRIIVCLGGMYFESFIAAAALLTWSMTESSLLNALAYQTMILASITTIGFNINPLMRYDGYFILSDLLEIPNLRRRATDAIQRVIARCTLGLRQDAPPHDRATSGILLTYGVASMAYRVTLMLGIATLLIFKFSFVGLVVACLFIGSQVVSQVWRLVRWLVLSERTAIVRGRAVAAALLIVFGVPALITLVPIPSRVATAGVIGRAEETVIEASTGGVITAIPAAPGETVDDGALLVELINPELDLAVAQARARFDLAHWARRRAEAANAADAASARRTESMSAESLESQRTARDELRIRAGTGGVVLAGPEARDVGRFVYPGEELCTIGRGEAVVRVLLPARDLVRATPEVGERVTCRSIVDPTQLVPGVITAVQETGSRLITHRALQVGAGGEILTNPETNEAIEPYFEVTIDLEFPDPAAEAAWTQHLGARVLVRFDAPSRTMASAARTQFLRLLNRLARE